jgi:hypothetical protein
MNSNTAARSWAIPLLLGCLIVAAPRTAPAQQKDKLFLKDGQILTGTLVNPDFQFNTIYGNVHIPNGAAQKLERRDEMVEILHTVNDEIITGYLGNEFLRLQIANGPVIEARKELIQRIVFAPRDSMRLQMKDYFTMKNGDVFYGTVLDKSFQFTTSYGVVSTAFASLLKLEDVNGQTRLYLSDGNTMMGYLASEYLNVRTNYGFDLKVPRSSIRLVQLR